MNSGLLHTGGMLASTAATQAVVSLVNGPQTGLVVERVIQAITGLLGAVAGLLWVVYAIRNGKGGANPPQPPRGPGVGLCIAFLTMLPALMNIGCHRSPESRVVAARGAYTAALNVASDLRESGELDDAVYQKIEVARVAASSALKLLELDEETDDAPNSQTLLTLERAVADIIAAVRAAYGNSGGHHQRSGGVVGNPSTRASAPDTGRGGEGEGGGKGGGGAVGESRKVGGDVLRGHVSEGAEGVSMDTRYFSDNLRLMLPPGDEGVYQTMWLMRACADDAVESGGPTAQLGIRIAAEAGRGEVPQVKAVFNWLRESITFKRDPLQLENVRHPDQLVLEVEEYGGTSADCDDVAMLGAALLRQCGIRPALVVVSVKPGGKYHHVTPAAYIGGQLVIVDAQEGMWRLPRNATRSAVLSW